MTVDSDARASAVLCALLSLHPRVYCKIRHVELSQLRIMERMPMPFDVAFFVHQRLREVRESMVQVCFLQ